LKMAWQILARPEGKNPGSEEGRNEGGIVIELALSGGSAREEVSRVAYTRENSTHPEVSFEDMLDIEMDKAKKAVEVLTELTADAGVLQ
jgi:hypothetical protein